MAETVIAFGKQNLQEPKYKEKTALQEFIFMWAFSALAYRFIHVETTEKTNNFKPRERKRKYAKRERFKSG